MGKKHRLSEIERPIDPYTTAPWEPGVPGRFATNEDDGDELSGGWTKKSTTSFARIGSSSLRAVVIGRVSGSAATS